MKERPKKMNPPGREVSVTDLQLADYLLASDFPLLRTEGSSRRVAFVFGGVPEGAVFRFYQGDDVISARRLFGAYRDLKGLSIQQFSRADQEAQR